LQNKLDNVQHALDTLKDKTDLHPRDLLLLRRKLAEVDSLYHDAKFDVPSLMGGKKEGGAGGIPEGQAVLAASLANAHETLRALLFKTDYYKVRAWRGQRLCVIFLWLRECVFLVQVLLSFPILLFAWCGRCFVCLSASPKLCLPPSLPPSLP